MFDREPGRGKAMIVKNGNNPDLPGVNLERAQQSREVSHAAPPEIPVTSGAPKAATPVNDQIALSLATKLLQQASSAGQEARLQRILQLKTAIVKEQYRYDPLEVGHALIEASLLGE
jgi:anti-sigma28 factor (negative regulator of flagellin synthesis)